MSDKRETALSRWSRLKRADVERDPRPPPQQQHPETIPSSRQSSGDAPAAEHGEDPPSKEVDTTPVPDLPDIAELNANSDFSAFLREGVSEEIRRRALRVLWRSDPVLANLDGLNDYDEDFRSAGVIAEAVRSAYRAGKGYARAEEQPPVSDSPAEPDALEASDDGAAEQAGADEDVVADGAPATAPPETEIAGSNGAAPEKKT